MGAAVETGKNLLRQVIIYDMENSVNSFADRKGVKKLHCSLIEKGQLNGRFKNNASPLELYICIATIYRGSLFEWACSDQEELDYDSFKGKVANLLCVQDI